MFSLELQKIRMYYVNVGHNTLKPETLFDEHLFTFAVASSHQARAIDPMFR